ncbi:glycerophosphodiester phosphodiesterase [Arcticibacterium luteifluviistationis]|uniref:Glycerophosphodiester phosphodiesterase n=1 Tax=Arcticibacterium luteifluviistationis TaxID=1784714 RepID=A0A2Z4G9A4_9BACT|nr:glycerophosphodiester phosphodiesterase family protein [Arcticibacterium luteifluviistationis]AWV97513.1 glycerophosphodiester phosphodiesterase [Arcticibacterium luteifluviistationis]
MNSDKFVFLKKCLFVLPFLLSNVLCVAQSESLASKGICAHRGANKTHPENTLTAFKEAIRLGAQMIEFDVQLTKDHKLIIMHDETVDRTTNGSGKVSQLTFEDIRKLDAGTWKSEEFAGEKVPTLQEALQMMPENIWLNIHLKGTKKVGIETSKVIIAENRMNQAVIACGKEAARGVRSVDSGLKICNMNRLNSRAAYIENTIKEAYPFLQIKSSRDDGQMLSDIKRLKDNGVMINYFHSEKVTELKTLFDAGVDFILTDNLEEMIQAFSKLDVH